MPAVQEQLVLSFARFVSGALLVLGIVGLFLTGFDYYSNVTGAPLLMYTVNPNTNVIHVVAGLVGIAMTGSARPARRYLLLVGGLGLPWAITGYVVEDTMSDFFGRNPALVHTHLAVSVGALALALWPHRPNRSPSPTAGETA